MSDPLSIAAGVAGLITLVDAVFRLVFKYSRSAVNSKEEIKNLADEIQALAGVLQSLRLLANGLEAEGHVFDPTIRVHHLGMLSSTLRRVQQRVEKAHGKFEKGSKTQQKLQHLKWPFSAGETKELWEDIGRQKSTISLALSADSLRKLQISLAKQDEMSQTLSTIANTVKRIEIQTQIAMSDAKKAVLDFFMKVSPQSSLEMGVKLRHPLTGLWLSGSPRFTTWLETPGSKLWLSGIPGAGKTVLAGAAIQDAITHSYSNPEVGVAFFFCDYKDSNTWDIVNILGAMASQIGRQNDTAYSRLQIYYDELHPDKRLEKSPDVEDLRAKITQMSEHFKQMIVIVDGLDECGDNTDTVVEILSELASYTPNMSMALFSRHEVNIQEWLQEDFDHIPITAKSDDVRLYVGAEVEKRIENRRLRITSMELKDEIVSKLVEDAKGMFRWVSCQLDYLCDCVNDADRRKALGELPPDLPETYRRLLERVNKHPARVKSLVQMCLQFIACASPPLMIPQLQQAVSTPETLGVRLDKFHLISEDEIARRCSSLIRKSEDGNYFEFSHFSVQEFLKDASLLNSPALEIYHISKSPCYTLLATQCLRFLQLENFCRLPEPSEKEAAYISQRNRENPFYEYAAVLWPKFARSHLADPVLVKVANSLFQPPKTFRFLAWSVEFLRHVYSVPTSYEIWEFPSSPDRHKRNLISIIRGILNDNFTPLHMAAALYIPEICKSLLDDKLDPNDNSNWGNPLELAANSLSAFCRIEYDATDDPRIHYSWCRELDLWSTTALENRLETIELLVGAGALVTDSPQETKMNLLDSSFLLATVFLDLSATTKLMALGVQPGSASPDNFSRCMAAWGHARKAGVSKEIGVIMESSLQVFLGHLFSKSIYPTETGRKIASIAWAAAAKFSFSLGGSDLIGQDPTSVEEALRAKTMTAVFDDDAETLRNCLVNGTLDISEPFHPNFDFPDYSCSLLHVAATANAASAGQMLLDFSPNLDALDSDGELPIHLCDCHESSLMLDLLLQKGASHIATDSSGKSIWHKSARMWSSGATALRRLLELDRDQTIEALLMRTPSGKTPLLSILAEPNSPNMITKALLIVDHCAGDLKFWKAHGTVFAAAAEFGSEIIIERLIQAGAELDPVGNDNLTPLHRLGSYTSLKCARLMKRLYPDAHRLRFQDQTPLEIYIEKQLKLGKKPNEDVLAVLATPEALSSQNTSGETVWSFCCKKIPTLSLSWNSHVRLYSHFDDIILAIFHLGAMMSHEKTIGQSGVLPLFTALGLECAQNELYTTDISCETLSTLISGSKFWEDARKSSAAVAFLIEAIRDGHLEAVKLILAHDVSVHQRVKQISPLEFTVQNFNGHEKVESDEADSKEILLEILSCGSLEDMKRYSPHGLGFGLLHRVVEPQHGGKADTYWLLKELIGRGADINGEARFMAGYTPIVHYLSRGFFETAGMLLDFGADPYANSAFDPVRASLTRGGLLFLKRLLKYSKETGISLHWNRTIATYTLELDGNSTDILGATCLHYIAWQGLSEILEFYTDKNLLEDINVTTTDGYTSVHFAAINNQAAAIDWLHAHGANLEVQANDGSSALHLAVRTQSLSAAKVLLELGAKSSLDAVAMTPIMYASVSKDKEMTDLLGRYFPLDINTSSFKDASTISPKYMELLAGFFEDAISEGDLLKCQRLYFAGCSLDTNMPSCGGCPPMITALRHKQLYISDWLLQCKATTLNVACSRHKVHILNELIGFSDFNGIINGFLTQYIEEGGDILGDGHQTEWAIKNDNIEGLKIFLGFVKEKAESISSPLQLQSSQVISTVANQRIYSTRGDSFYTPLHVAALYGNILAIDLLVGAGATIDGCDSNYFTPLECILTQNFACEYFGQRRDTMLDAALRLIQLGAMTGIVLLWPSMLLLGNVSSSAPLSQSLFEQMPAACPENEPPTTDRTTIVSYTYEAVPRNVVSRLQNFVPEIAGEDFGGKSFLHCAICWRGYSKLMPYWKNEFQKMTPFPWHYDWPKFHEMAFLTTDFALYQQRLPHDTFKQLMNLEPERGISPLCRAASRGITEIMENCLAMGADIDFEGCSLGSALMIACACGRLDAVKFLVLRGAAISYVGKAGLTSAVVAGRRSKTVIAWLLVGRFNEQRRLKYDVDASS